MARVRQLCGNSVLAVTALSLLIAAFIVGGQVRAQPHDCCAGRHPFVTLYDRPLDKVDVILAAGDGQAFGALAQDPLLQRPDVIAGGAREYAYRAQRPLWSLLAWVGSGGQPALVGWALATLTIASVAFAVWAAATLLRRRAASPWWALAILIVGMESIVEFTPELLAFGLAGFAVLAWEDQRRWCAAILLCFAVATRESSLVVAAAMIAWTFVAGAQTRSWRRALPLAVPFALFAVWAVALQLQLGYFPNNSRDRLGLPGRGLLDAMSRAENPRVLVLWVLVAVALTTIVIAKRSRDVLSWIVVSFALFATVFGPEVWLTNFGFLRALTPLYGFGLVVAASVLQGVFTPLAAVGDGPLQTEPRKISLDSWSS